MQGQFLVRGVELDLNLSALLQARSLVDLTHRVAVAHHAIRPNTGLAVGQQHVQWRWRELHAGIGL